MFHPEYGLEKTMPTLIVDGVRFRPGDSTKVVWFPGDIPMVTALWQPGGHSMIENFWTAIDHPILIREFTFHAESPVERVELELSLYGNPAIFSEFLGNAFGLAARGFDAMLVNVPVVGIFHERTITVPMTRDGSLYRMAVMYSLGIDVPDVLLSELQKNEREYWGRSALRWRTPNPQWIIHETERLFTASAMGLRSAVSDTGRFDASLWQYGYEWSGDAANVAEALVYSGQFESAQAVLENIFHRLTIPEGMTMESGRFRGGMDSELNNNGEILKACRTYLDWTGDREFIADHYDRISALANYLLQPEFLNEETGMLMACRDIWERNAAMGILPGYDIAHQTFGILGLRDAAHIANLCSNENDRYRWAETAKRMRESVLNHPTHSMIEGGRIIKRRLLDSSVQLELLPNWVDKEFQNRFSPEGMPLSEKGARVWEPDISECLPIALGVIDPQSEVARNTLEALETLWSQQWDGGGYGRYNIASEPDSPGPWPLATMYMAAAYLEAGDFEKAPRALDWLASKAGAGGSWFEFYGDRPTPPLPPTGILVWAWAQWITLVVRHLIHAEVHEDRLWLAPRLAGFKGDLRFRNGTVEIP